MTCGQIEDLEHLFLTCEKTKLVWKQLTTILEKIIPGGTLTGTKALLLRVFTWERDFEMTFGVFSVLVSQINVLESYLDIYLFQN